MILNLSDMHARFPMGLVCLEAYVLEGAGNSESGQAYIRHNV